MNFYRLYVGESMPLRKARVPVIFNLLIDKLPPGDYRIEIQARDSAENVSAVRSGDFSVE